MLLHKPQVYRHLLFNKLGTTNNNSTSKWGRIGRLGSSPLPWGVVKLCILLVLFEVYIKWAKIDRESGQAALQSPPAFAIQYLYLFGLSFAEFAVFQLMARFACVAFLGWEAVIPKMDSIIAGLILSSFGKLLHIVVVIWDYHDMEFSYLINLIVFTSNLEAVSVIFSVPYRSSLLILGTAVIGKYIFQGLVHHFDPTFPSSLL